MSPAIRPFLELLPLTVIIAVVYSAMKPAGLRNIAEAGGKFLAKMYGGIILFSAAIHVLCLVVRWAQEKV